ncbi:MAG: HAD family acid phosphatase [Opitutus sp.]
MFRPLKPPLGLVLAALVMFAGCATHLREPANLQPHKAELRRYVESGEYLADIAVVAEQAKAWIKQRAAARRPGERLCVVMDLDETLLFNWPEILAADFAYDPVRWDAWVAEASVTAIQPSREIFETARAHGVEIVFLTGRRVATRKSTEENLRRIGCAEYAALILRPAAATGTAAAFKTSMRKKLNDEGRVIIANVGDQPSDLSGGFAERAFKLPDPFYLTE